MPERAFAIGDIHGCPLELDTLLASLALGAGDLCCFLGDYVDRGPDSRAVIDRLIELAAGPAECIFLRGNHEDMLLGYLGRDGSYGESFLENGGHSTLRSYEVAGAGQDELLAALPAAHLRFFDDLRWYQDLGRVLCVHAGVRPGVTLEQQSREDLVWIREDFHRCRRHGFERTVIYGHTPRHRVEVALPQRVGLDTGLVYGGDLSCLELRSGELHQVRRHSREVRVSVLAAAAQLWEPTLA